MEQPTSEPAGMVPKVEVVSDPVPMTPIVAPKRSRSPFILGILGVVAGVAALGISLWSAAQSDRETLRLSTELAQLRVSLELYARSGAANLSTDSAQAADIVSRLEALEKTALSAAIPVPTEATPAAPVAATDGEDCLPSGMRLLVAMGDKYAVCGQDVSVEVGMVDNGYITLADGTTIPSGGTMPLANSSCTIGVTSNGDEGLTGYAEIRVTC